jgi:hypothetical protein
MTEGPAELLQDDWLTTEEAAALLGLSPSSLTVYRHRGTGPKFFKSTGKPGAKRGVATGLVYYRKQDVLAWRKESA